MSKLAIMLQLNGRWDSVGRYKDFDIDGIVVNDDSNYSQLNSAIAEHLMIDTSAKIIEFKYSVNKRCPLIKIRNDMRVRVYMEMKKGNKNLGMYLLCIIVRDFDLECSMSNASTIAGTSDYRNTSMVQLSSNCNTIGEVSGTVKLIDIQTSPAIVEYESIIITEHTPNVIEVGQVYQDKQTIVTAMNYCLVCVGDNCTWDFKSTSINESALFKVRKYNSLHTCSLMDNTYIQRKLTTMGVGSIVMPKYADPKTIYTPKDIQIDMLSDHGVNVTYMQAWREKKKALEFLRGHPADFYIRLPSYFTSIKGWEHYRPVVVVDGTFLKSAYRGIMLTASTMDAAGSILPLAYAVVDSENDASWRWFFEQFKHAYGEKPNICVVSDQNESILKATSTVYTGIPHYACIWHIWTNVRSKFKKGHLKLSELYLATARSYTLDELNERISKIEEIDTRVKAYLYDIGYHRWSQIHATVNRTWKITSNIAESLNAVTKDVRVSTDYIHTVIDDVKRFIVCLQNKRCSCGIFQLDELSCAQALAALRHRDESYENYCSPYYTREILLQTYEIPVDPLPDESKWNVPQHVAEEVVKSPTGKRQPGRPQK
ncbi:uncharacterized protein [Nicotiana tomentosiformis]|uniref:uncharacterized protein n=1 Tax=Nicotiana tomentosiformis TaxID=4098 RepID=UPI00388C69F3